VLGLVADDHLEDRPVAGADALEHLQRATADGREVLEHVGAAQARDVAAHGPRRLEGVVEVREVAAQQRLAAVAVDEPQVLVGGDVPEVPAQRAHERVVHALERVVVERGDECEGARAGPVQGVAQVRADGGGHGRANLLAHRDGTMTRRAAAVTR
jgi:hypothetical protein